jgi:N-ethylmaleimide reductase
MKNQTNQTTPYSHYKLFSPVQLGPYTLNHRVALAPMTRLRADAIDAPSDMMVKFYGQRSSEGGLLIAEGTAVSITARS